MEPIAISRHAPTEGPGHFASFLQSRDLPWRLVAIHAGAPVPAPAAFAAFHWHGDSFSPPAGAKRIASTEHQSMQCHLAMTDATMRAASDSPAVPAPSAMPALNAARRPAARRAEGLRR